MAVFNLPVNSVSFGQVSTGLLREAFSRKSNSHPILPIGKVDLDSQKPDKEFENWINKGIAIGMGTDRSLENKRSFQRTDTSIKLWHMQPDSLFFPTDKRHLISFYEADQPTGVELNIVRNCDKVFFTSEYTCELFHSFGCDQVEFLPLFFDSYNFKKTSKKYFEDDRIIFTLAGKLEKRKHHLKALKAWRKKYGNNKKFFLNCAIYNHFLSQEENNNSLGQALDGGKPFNINFLPWMKENSVYNDFLNASDIMLAMSGGEGWGLPEFHSVAMGSHAVVLNCNGYKSWANEENSVLVEPNGKIPVYDGRFFVEGNTINQGMIFDFNEDDFISACEEAVKRVESNKNNESGLKLQENFKVSTTYDKIL